MADGERTTRQRLPVLELFGSETTRRLVQYALDDLDDWQRPSEITDALDVSYESFRKHVDKLVAFGILEPKSEGVPIPHYRLADTPVATLLAEWDGYPVTELFATKGREKLVEWFLTGADPEESYSKSAIEREHDTMTFRTVAGNVDALVESGLVREVDGARGTEYQVDTDSVIYGLLVDLNNAIYEYYQQHDG